MSNTLTINQKLCPAGLKNNPNRALAAVLAVVIHTTANRVPAATAKSHADYQYNGSGGTETSWHYTVDDSEIWQSFNDTQMCWHCGNSEGNAATIGIEICVNAGAEKFKEACKLAAKLTAELLKKHSLTIENVKQHYDYTKKDCPHELRTGEWGITWRDFLSYVRDDLTSDNTSKTPIMGKSEAAASQLDSYAKEINPFTPSYGVLFIEEGDIEGVRGDIAYCQSLHETAFFKFGGDVLPHQNNFCGIGATGNGVHGLSFQTPRDGIKAQIQHLKAYASKETLIGACVDPRFNLVERGIAQNWEDLDMRWAMTTGYGSNIVKLWNASKLLKALPEMSVIDAITELVRFDVIQTSEYWAENYTKVQYLDLLLIKTAQKLSESEKK